MPFKRTRTYYNRETLFNYDVYPKVFVAGKEAEIHIVNLGYRNIFTVGKEYTITIGAYRGGAPKMFPATADFTEEKAVCDDKGGFTFKHTFTEESEHSLFIDTEENGERKRFEISVYCVDGDLVGRYPFHGDLHMHTTCSDGRQDPEVVCAVYRSHGYDFFAITDHGRYYPSLRAIDFYKNVPTEFVIMPGEEVHIPPVCDYARSAHIVNFGGEYSINALVEGSSHLEDVGEDKKLRSIRDDCPDVMTFKEYEKKMLELAEEIDVPENVDKIPAAVYKWIYDEIRKAGGLGISPHPNWVTGHTFHVSDAMQDYFVKNKIFDAFEVLGGENYYEHNGFQTARYYDDKAKGYRYPIVGSTDSHCCYDYNDNYIVGSTIVFSHKNERKEIINSIKDFFSVAVDGINEDFRLVGEPRLVRYACFLIKNYFTYHDEICYEEGRLMKQYVTGTAEEKEEAIKTLSVINGRVQKLREKYFDF